MKKGKIHTSVGLVLGLVVIILLAGAIIEKAEIIGVPKSKIVEDARKRQDIADNWKVIWDINDKMCALVFYDEVAKECEYSVYLTREGMAQGYFFRHGGLDPYMVEDAKAMIFEGKGIAVMSMNLNGVCKIVTEAKTVMVDSTKPFSVLLPMDCGEITLYDAGGNIVTLYDTYTG